jgi:hypothetical protein
MHFPAIALSISGVKASTREVFVGDAEELGFLVFPPVPRIRIPPPGRERRQRVPRIGLPPNS